MQCMYKLVSNVTVILYLQVFVISGSAFLYFYFLVCKTLLHLHLQILAFGHSSFKSVPFNEIASVCPDQVHSCGTFTFQCQKFQLFTCKCAVRTARQLLSLKLRKHPILYRRVLLTRKHHEQSFLICNNLPQTKLATSNDEPCTTCKPPFQ